MTKVYSNHQLRGGIDIFGIDNTRSLQPKDKIQIYTEEELARIRANEKTIEKTVKEADVSIPDNIFGTTYKDLDWELKAPREGNEKKLFYYYESLKRIRKEGGSNSRHLYPNEVFGLICDGLENKLSGNLKEVYDDMISSYGEWFSMAFERRKDELIAYLDPENLNWDGSKYIIDGKKLKYSDEKKFNIKGIESEKYIDLNEFEDDFIKFMYSRSFDDLPEEIKTGDKKARVYLPSEGVIWPVGRGNVGRFGIVGGYGCIDWASRWVRKNFP